MAEPSIFLTPGEDEDPELVSGEPVDESDVLGDAVWLADPSVHGGED